MSDIPVDEEEASPHPADPAQALTDFVGAFTDPQAQGVMRDVAVRLQNYDVQSQIAADNSAAANRLVSNLGVFKDGLASRAQADPAFTYTGVDIVPGVVEGIVGSHPFLPDEQRQDTYEQLTSDMQRDIARAGVMSMADRNDAAARAMLDHPKIAGLFDDQDRLNLNGYIGAMATARDIDASALSQQRAVDAERTRDISAIGYFGALLDPQNLDLTFPPGWAEKVTADPTLSPGDTASMLNLYGRLQKTGDVPVSDPMLTADIISMAATGNPMPVSSVLQHVGDNLNLSDALTLAAMAGPQDRAGVQNLAATIQSFRNQVVTPENGPAGMAAFERFVNWIVPEFRGGGSLDPKADTYILPTGDSSQHGAFWSRFAPRTDDFVLNDRAWPRSIDELHEDTGDRISLNDIFGPMRRRNDLDTVVRDTRSQEPFPNPSRIPIGGSTEDVSGAQSKLPEELDNEGNPSTYYNPEIKS